MASGVYFLAPVHPRRGGWKMSTVQYLLPRSLPGASISVPLLGTAQQTSSVQVVYECESAMVSGLWRPLKGYLLEAKHNEYLRSGGLPRGAVGRPPADGGKIQGATPCQKTLSLIRRCCAQSRIGNSRELKGLSKGCSAYGISRQSDVDVIIEWDVSGPLGVQPSEHRPAD